MSVVAHTKRAKIILFRHTSVERSLIKFFVERVNFVIIFFSVEFVLKFVVEGIVRDPYGDGGGNTIEHVMHENSVAARGWCDGGRVLASDECLTAETREGRFYF